MASKQSPAAIYVLPVPRTHENDIEVCSSHFSSLELVKLLFTQTVGKRVVIQVQIVLEGQPCPFCSSLQIFLFSFSVSHFRFHQVFNKIQIAEVILLSVSYQLVKISR